uniref:ankyrin repeat domain-containing protein 34A isoform X3 n=1 Tax=Gasterosteus aculeatus aculeatus TaxID=481459 RepID=UPI001A9A2923|nr:ankyrin repeat domain-containing protein 34A isoform X3 [Gasterosteus aculeatus aculeatus]
MGINSGLLLLVCREGSTDKAMADPLSDSSPLISAAASCKLRLVRLLVEGGAQVNGCNPRGETPLLAACKAMRGEPAGREAVKLLTYLLLNKVLVDACRARGRDIIIIATEIGGNGGPVTRHYLNVPPCPDNSPASCMSPSDVVLTTGSPNSPEGESVFNFRAAGQRGSSSSSSSSLPPARHRVLSEPWLAVHNLACLNRTYEEGMRERRLQEEADREDPRRERRGDEEPRCPRSGVQRRPKRLEGETEDACREDFLPGLSQSVLSPAEGRSPQGGQSRPDPQRSFAPGGSTLLHHSQLRRNTLPSVTALHLPPLADHPHLRVPTRVSTSESRRMVFLPQPPGSSPPSSSSRGSARPAVLPRLSLTSSAGSDRSKRALRRHSVQLEQMGGGEIL